MRDNPNSLPLRERATYYRQMAKDAMECSEGAQTPLARTDFLKLAHAWHALAVQIETALGFPVDPEDSDESDPTLHFRRPDRLI